MGLSRSTFYDTAPATLDAGEVLARIGAVCDGFECYGYRRAGAALRHQGIVVNSKRLRRLMREHDFQPKRRRRYTVTTDSNHDSPIFPDVAKDVVPDRPNQLWVADLTYVAVSGGFVYLAAILDAWSRKVVGYAISRSMEARIAVAALKAAIRVRSPPKGCIHHSDRGSQYASESYRELLATHGLVGSMSCRGNPYDNAKAESFMKTLKVEAGVRPWRWTVSSCCFDRLLGPARRAAMCRRSNWAKSRRTGTSRPLPFWAAVITVKGGAFVAVR